MKTHIAMLSGLAVAILVVSGCGNTHGQLCNRAQECSGGSERDIEACAVNLDQRARVASLYECDRQWNAYIDCLTENAVCDGNKLGGCEAQKDAVDNCVDDGETASVRVRLEGE